MWKPAWLPCGLLKRRYLVSSRFLACFLSVHPFLFFFSFRVISVQAGTLITMQCPQNPRVSQVSHAFCCICQSHSHTFWELPFFPSLAMLSLGIPAWLFFSLNGGTVSLCSPGCWLGEAASSSIHIYLIKLYFLWTLYWAVGKTKRQSSAHGPNPHLAKPGLYWGSI